MDHDEGAQNGLLRAAALDSTLDTPTRSPHQPQALFVYRSSHPGIANPIFEQAETARAALEPELDTSPALHVGVCCDGIHCGKLTTSSNNTFISGPRFHCMICPNFDLCERCATSSQNDHDKSHSMIKFVRPQNGFSVVHGSDMSAVRELLEALQMCNACSPADFLRYYATMTSPEQQTLMQALRSLEDNERGMLMAYLMSLEPAERPTFLDQYQSFDDSIEKLAYLRIVIGAELVWQTTLDSFDDIKVDLNKLEIPQDTLTRYNIRSLRGNVVCTVELVPMATEKREQREKGPFFHPNTFFGNIKPYEYRDDGLFSTWKAGELATRVLDLLPGSNDDDLRCSIRSILNMDIGTVPPYEALSYTWKETAYERTLSTKLDPEYDKAIRTQFEILHYVFCDEGYLQIGTGLRDALLHLRHPAEKRTLWVDQICIDQNNLSERAHHVTLMRYIYNRARRVIVWTGEEDDHSDTAFRLIKSTEASIEPLSEDAVTIPSHDSDEWQPLYNFLERPVFTRGWVIQEIALGQQVTVRCGEKEINFEDLGRAAMMLSQPSWQLAGRNPRQRTSALYSHLINLIRQRIQNCEPITLHQILFETSKFGITEERDRLYAILGLLQRRVNGEVHIDDYGIRPDYKKPTRDVFIDATKSIILNDKTLDICGRSGDPALDSASNSKNLPSWVPDLGAQKEHIFMSDPGVCPKFKASKDLQPFVSWPFDERQDVMHSPVYFVDKVLHVGKETHSSVTSLGIRLLEWSKLASLIGEAYPRGTSTMNAFYETCTAIRTAIPADMALDDLFVGFLLEFSTMVMMASREERQRDSSEDPRDNPLAAQIISTCLEQTEDNAEFVNSTDSKIDRAVNVAKQTLLATTSNRKLFVTEKGYLGLGTLWMKTGDEVVVLPGARVPFLVRRAPSPLSLNLDDSSYNMIGECYVQGVMEGEACVDGETPGKHIYLY